MDSGKSIENEKLQAMKNQNKGCFLYSNLMLYSVSAGFVCSLICYCPYWYCSLSKCSMKDFLFMYVPCIWFSFSSPKCLFIIANIIIVFLVGESNFMGSSGNRSSSSSSSSSPADELYDEYVQRSSRRVRNSGAAAAAASNFPEKIKQKKPQAHLDDQMKVIKQRVKRVHQVKDLIKEKEKKFDDDEEEEAGLPADELNKRAEEFIARVNKQRWLEARSLICRKAARRRRRRRRRRMEMATSCSSTHCRSSPYSFYALSSSYSFANAQHQRIALLPQRFLSAKLSLQCRRNSHSNLVLTEDGAVVTTPAHVENETPLKESKVGLMSGASLEESNDLAGFDMNGDESSVSITIVGASGDLAKKKIFPALFALYYEGCLPEHFTIYGYARSKMTDAELRNIVSRTLTCRIDKRENCDEKMDEFLKRCFYHSGQYDSEENFAALDKKLKGHEGKRVSNRLFYLSIPPNIFIDAVRCASLSASSGNGWTRVIVEKPFGRDSESSSALTKSLKQYLKEDQIFRIDHYLGKELVENLSVLRFSNLIFEPLWSRQYIRNVQLIFSEDFGTEGRGGYFDNYGIIRDIMQNHLLQILALFAMETPVSLDAEDIRNEKVKVLRSMRPLRLEDVVTGQYKSHSKGGVTYPGYTDDKTVPKDSLTPTFAAAALFIDNARWDGVPFLLKAGKALHTRRAEIRVQFRHVPGNLYNRNFGTDLDQATNELVIRVQPDEAIYLKINNKVPGLGMRLDRSNLNLHYAARYSKEIPDAYERLLLDAIEGERRLFIRSDELDAAWSLFTLLLKELEEKKIIPEYYPYGSRGPVGAHYLAARYNVRWGDLSLEK